MKRSSAVLGAALVGACLAVPSDATAADFAGKTSQGRTVTLTVGDDGSLQKLRINWFTRRCTRSVGRFQDITKFLPPIDSATATTFRDAGPYTIREGAYRHRVSVVLTGKRAGDGWSGTLSVKVNVRRRGKAYGSCSRTPITWSASPA